jgi:hypothetical protein
MLPPQRKAGFFAIFVISMALSVDLWAQQGMLDAPQPKSAVSLDETYEGMTRFNHLGPQKPPICRGEVCDEVTYRRLTFRPDGSFAESVQVVFEIFAIRGGKVPFQPQTFGGEYTVINNDMGTKGELRYSSGPQKRARFIVPVKYQGFWPPEYIVFGEGSEEIKLRLVNR